MVHHKKINLNYYSIPSSSVQLKPSFEIALLTTPFYLKSASKYILNKLHPPIIDGDNILNAKF